MSEMLALAPATRLQHMPNKVRLPFSKMLKAGHISEEILTSVLDAGELDPTVSGDPTRLLPFAVSLLFMRSNGVPVTDVVAMAKQQGRKVSLKWSEKRWRLEHDRLSRAETLKTLAADNVQYDVGSYQQHLPTRFPGYLIRSSRRLGMEGLRQRHCVASYHQRVMCKHCAIACVFIGKVRWTVEMFLTGKENTPLRVGQIKRRGNKNPDKQTRKNILDALGIEESLPGTTTGISIDRRHQYEGNLRRLLPVLREAGFQHVTVSFDGYGDSGSIDAVVFDGNPYQGPIEVEMRVIRRNYEDGGWVHTAEDVRMSLENAIRTITDDYLDETGVNWYDNDGGYGEMMIDVENGTVSMEVNVRYTDSSREYSEELDIESEPTDE